MYPITNAVKALFEAEQTKVLRITGSDKNGTAITITDDNVLADSFEIDRYSCNGQKLEVGTAIAAQMSMRLENIDGKYDGIIFEGTELFVEVGVADWTQASPTITWVPCGYFTPDMQPRRLDTISITALDRMMKIDIVPPTLTPWTTQSGEIMHNEAGEIIYFIAEISFPATIQGLVQQVCLRTGMTMSQDISSLPNANYTISEMPQFQQDVTFRKLIQWCAGIMGTNAWIDWNGELRFSWYNNTTGYTSTVDNRYSSDLYENPLVITGVKFTDANDAQTVYLAGVDTYSLDLTGNSLMNGDNAATILQNIYSVVHNFAYTPFSATVIAAPYLWPMDRMTFTDKEGHGHVSLLTNVNFGLNGNTALSAVGETIQTASTARPSGFTQQQKRELEKVQRVNMSRLNEAVNHATEMITGGLGGYVVLTVNETTGQTEEILIMDSPDKETAVNVWRFNQGGLGHSSNGYNGPFNDVALTADGQINANMITVGTMVADRILGGTLTLGGGNNSNGLLNVKNSSGNIIGSWGKDGISILNGDIEGSTIKLGGNNNSYGKLEMISDSGANNGGWDVNGITVGGTNNSQGKIGFNRYDSGKTAAYFMLYTYNRVATDEKCQRLYLYVNKGQSGNAQIMVAFDGGAPLENIAPQTEFYTEVLIESNLKVYNGNLTVSGTKSRAVATDQYSNRLLYCYETSSPMFGDVGEGTIGEDGKCYIWLDPVFAQTITTTQYQVFLQRYGSGDCWVSERKGSYFVVEGTPGMAFGWEIKAKQKDFDQRRLERDDDLFTVPTQTYGEDAAQHINDIQKERISA